MWNMPAFLPSCSQAVVTEPSPVLCRNYDYSPDLWEADDLLAAPSPAAR